MNHNKEVTLAKNNLEKFKVSCGIDPEDANSPHIIRGVTETWPCISWSVSKLGELVGNKLVKFRIGPRRIRNGTSIHFYCTLFSSIVLSSMFDINYLLQECKTSYND